MKKLTLLALAVGALVAFAAPASAQANEFTYSGEITIHGTITWTAGPGEGFASGPCTVSGEGEVEGTTGVITKLLTTTPCDTNVANCLVQAAGWSAQNELHLTTPDGITITSVTFYTVFTGSGCTAAGIATGIQFPIAGNLTGTTKETGLINFEKAGDLKLKITGGAVSIDGKWQLTDPKEKPIVIH